MEWTVLFLKYKQDFWRRMSESEGTAGQKSYALRQMDLWGKMAGEAKERLDEVQLKADAAGAER